MGLFSTKDEKEQKKAEKLEAKMKLYGLEKLDPSDKEKVSSILSGLMGNSMIELGTIFSGKGEDSAKLSYLHALVEQNWIIIKMLNDISKK